MNCDFDITLISGHLDGENTQAEDERLLAHLETCAHCRELLAIMQENDARLKEETVQPPLDLTNRIMQQVRKQPKKSKKPFYISVAASGLAAAAMLALVISGGVKLPTDDAAFETAIERAVPETPETTAACQEDTLEETLKSGVYYHYGSDEEQAEFYSASGTVPYSEDLQADKKQLEISAPAVLVIRADSSQVNVEGEHVFLTNHDKLLGKTDYELTGNETAAYMVTWETLLQIAAEYEDVFEMEKYYTLDSQYLNAIIIFTE